MRVPFDGLLAKLSVSTAILERWATAEKARPKAMRVHNRNLIVFALKFFAALVMIVATVP
jgi:VIT1/CCC1 family predicted Fe2+/Mn2+ transporter